VNHPLTVAGSNEAAPPHDFSRVTEFPE